MNLSRNTLEAILSAIEKKGAGLTLNEIYAIERAKELLRKDTEFNMSTLIFLGIAALIILDLIRTMRSK